MFQRIIRCPISFFDTNPIGMFSFHSIQTKKLFSSSCNTGRILNRFTRDINVMDTYLESDLSEFLEVNY